MPRMKRRGSFDSSCNWDEVSIAEESSQPRSARRPSIGGFFSNSDDGASGDNNSSASSLFSELEDYEYALKSNASGPPPTRTQVKLKLSGDHHHHHHHHHRNPNTTVWMRNTRIGIFLILFLVMTACASTTYFLTRSYQDEYYQQKFERYASDIQTVLNIHMETIVLETYNSAFGWSSLATDQQWTWPFVTIPHFEQRGQHLIQLMSSSGTMASQNCSMMSLNVMVHPQQRLEWETYSVEHQGWVQQGLDYSFQQQPNNNSTSKALPIPPKIHPNNNNDINNMTTTHTQFHGVTWQVVPAPQNPTMVNYDTLSAPGMEGFVKSLQTQMPPLLTGILQQPLNNQSAASSSSTLTQPIYQYNLQNIKVLVGYLQATFSWESMFANALPEGVPPLQILLENTCDDETVTLQVHGPSVTLLGDDNSNIQEDDDTISLTVPLNHTITNSYLLEPLRNAVQDSSPIQNTDNYNHYNGTNHHHNCFYEFTIYPTFKFRETYTNSNISPRNSTMGVIFVFVLAGTVFAIHDACISKQTAKVEKAGARTDAIVSSLFPDQVRDRMLLNTSSNHTNDGYSSNHSRDGTNTSHKRRARKIQEFYKQGPSKTLRNIFEGQKEETVTEEEEEQDIASKLLQTKPIADLFPNATVLFADIAGFTLWSSEREPTDVFVLLETLYGAMDKLANKYRIFKVETIGDCYVAVTGLPEPRDDHAVVMAKFAVKVLEKIKLVLSQELLDALGPDVTNLAMRFGLHSGPVTAGVLRGEKSRFQLFGDTVNTAARHETTGKPNCIHLSATTAQLLKQGGKEIWIQKRKDEVKAKGKGRMITYWLTLPQTAQVFKQLAFMKDRSYRMRKYENVFLGSQAVDALVYNGLATSRTNAIQLGRALAKELGLFKHSMDPTELFDDDDNFYEFKDPIDENDKKPEWASVWDPECGILADPILQFDSSMSNEADVFLRCLDIRDRKQPLVTYKNCFIGSEAVDALVLSGYCLTREKAVDFGRKLEQELSLFGSVTGGYDFQDENFLYRLSDVFQERSRNAQMFLSIRESLNHELLDSKVDAFKNCVLPLVRHRNHHMKAYKNVFVGEGAYLSVYPICVAMSPKNNTNHLCCPFSLQRPLMPWSILAW